MLKYLFFILAIVLIIVGCNKSTDGITEIQFDSGLEGQLYANAGPGFHPAMLIATIVVLKSDSTTEVTEVKSDSSGEFKINLAPGNYVLYVKESHDIYYSGPYKVVKGSYTESIAYLYDARIVELNLSPNKRFKTNCIINSV